MERWLIRCKNSGEKVKMTLDIYYSLRTNAQYIMTGWDTKGDWFRIAKNNSVSNYFVCLRLGDFQHFNLFNKNNDINKF